jgi:xanthine dehydrogenase accessory factor
MRDRRDIVELYHRRQAAALATLVVVEGSSYRRTGARLLIAADGSSAGAISGGCLEAEVIRKAQWLVRRGAVLEHYSTLFDDTSDLPYGLGSGGTVQILLEPANTPEFDALMRAMEHSLQGHPQHVLNQLPTAAQPLQRRITDADGGVLFATSGDWVTSPQSCFSETLRPPQRLLIFGAGDDARPLASMAALLGWSIAVIDSRAQWARPERFPQAERVLTSLRDLPIATSDAVVLMTHSYEQDRDWLTAVLPHRPRYIGLLGSRHRSALLIAEAAAHLGWPMDSACEGLFAPVGLDLGGDGAEPIALATIAEIQACIEDKLGHSRRMTPTLIEEQLQLGGASRYLQTQCSL